MQRSKQCEFVACNSAASASTCHVQAGVQDCGMLSLTALSPIRNSDS
jgi:hypothetical protein